MYITPVELYQRLKASGITEQTGQILMQFMDIELVLKDRSAVGDVFQAWLGEWMKRNGIEYRTKENTQEFPDFLLDKESNKRNLLEVKIFNYDARPGFDIANFDTYRRSLTTDAYRLDADYLIFGYTLNRGEFRIRDLWLKKIWEITSSSKRYPVNFQVKQDIIHNIRPRKWYSESRRYPLFESRKQFVFALYETIKQYKTDEEAEQWLTTIQHNYEHHTGHSL